LFACGRSYELLTVAVLTGCRRVDAGTVYIDR
jgi:hypothetical protein